MKFSYAGVTYEMVGQGDMTLAEGELLEDVTGLSTNALGRMSSTCVCGDFTGAHAHADPKDTSCAVCPCPEFEDIVPRKAARAAVWLTMRRSDPGLTFEAVGEIPESAITVELDAVEVPKEDPSPSEPAATPT